MLHLLIFHFKRVLVVETGEYHIIIPVTTAGGTAVINRLNSSYYKE